MQSKEFENKGSQSASIPKENTIDYSVSAGLVSFLQRLNMSFAFTSYQSNSLYLIGRNMQGGVNIHQSVMPKPMGLYLDSDGGLTLSGAYQILRFQNVLEAKQRINGTFDACYVPRVVHVTGRLDAHDVGVDNKGRAVFVNTRFNCIATVSDRHSFETVWQPPFISAIVDEDRCHLNGMALDGGVPLYATAVSRSDTVDGWRDRRGDGGVVIDIQSNKIICKGLSMPHSPRMYNGELWILNSGTGYLGVVNRDKKPEEAFEPRVFCPGFLRGLAFIGDYPLVGLSKPRYKRFEGLELEQALKDTDSVAWCGIQVIQLSTGTCVEWLRIDGNLNELYDLEVIPGVATPMAVPAESAEAAQLITRASELGSN